MSTVEYLYCFSCSYIKKLLILSLSRIYILNFRKRYTGYDSQKHPFQDLAPLCISFCRYAWDNVLKLIQWKHFFSSNVLFLRFRWRKKIEMKKSCFTTKEKDKKPQRNKSILVERLNCHWNVRYFHWIHPSWSVVLLKEKFVYSW